MRATGLLEHAAANRIVMIFPQNFDEEIIPFNHCWDVSTKDDIKHPQMRALQEMTRGIYGYDMFTGEGKPEYAMADETMPEEAEDTMRDDDMRDEDYYYYNDGGDMEEGGMEYTSFANGLKMAMATATLTALS